MEAVMQKKRETEYLNSECVKRARDPPKVRIAGSLKQ